LLILLQICGGALLCNRLIHTVDSTPTLTRIDITGRVVDTVHDGLLLLAEKEKGTHGHGGAGEQIGGLDHGVDKGKGRQLLIAEKKERERKP